MASTPSTRWYVARGWSLVALMMLLAVVPVAALGIVALDSASDSVQERVADGQLAIGRTLAEQAERDIELVERRTARIGERPTMAQLVRARDRTGLEALIGSVVSDRDHLRRLAVYTRDGDLVGAAPEGRVPVPPEGSASTISEATVRVSDESALVVLAYPVPGTDAEVVAEIDLARVVPGVREARFGRGGFASLALADGTVLVTGDRDKRGRVLPDAVGVVDEDNQQRTIEEYRSRGSEEPQLAAVTRLDNGWFLLVTQPRREAFAPVRALRRSLVLAALATLLGGGMAALWIARSLRRAQLELSASEQRARQITDAAHNAFIAIDGQGRVTEWNSAAASLFGWTAREARGRPVGELIVPARLREPHEAWRAGLATRGASSETIETTVVDRGGREFPIELTISELPGVDGGSEFFAFLRDISERKQLERERADARRKLELANEELRVAGELKNDFLAMASHELRTPLTSISGFAKTMRSMWHQLGDEDKRRYVSIIDEQSDRLGRLVTDLLLLSRIEQGGLRLDPTPVDVGEAIERALRDMAIPLDVRVHCPDGVRVLVDEDHLQQVLINLFSNALKYGQPPVDVEVRVGEREQGGRELVAIAVEDHGTGVPPQFVDRLFERFSQAPEHQSDLRAGAGLGLSIVAGLVEAHGGDVHYETGHEGGARFVVCLPLSP